MISVIAHYQEIALKGKNRKWFLQQLLSNLRQVLTGIEITQIRTPMGRVEIVLAHESDWPEVRERLGYTVGLANFSLARRATLDLDALTEAVIEHLPTAHVDSFRVTVRRADKTFPIPSPVIERKIGSRVQAVRGWHVNLSNPALVIGVELVPDEAFFYYHRLPGQGGLPMGTSGRVAVLLSGGIDSPVAAWRMMRRGCHATLIHFHAYPFVTRASQEKAIELARILTRYQLHSRLYLVPFGELQRQITQTVPGPLRVVVYRRMMMRIAERLARAVKAHALVTGEVVGQVASQTVENMSVIENVTAMPVFRPLIGMDKEEITAAAQRLGTFAISILPDEDCCSLFTPRHPATRARMPYVEGAERDLAIAEMVDSAIANAVVEEFYYPRRMVKSPATMVFSSVRALTDALQDVAQILPDRVAVSGTAPPELIDRLAHTAAFGADDVLKGTARWVLLHLGAKAGIRFASIHDLYMAIGRGEAGGFTVPAINIRAMAYDTGRAVFRAARKLDAGAFILEIARSEIGYTEQRPHEYAAIMMAAALREGFTGPLFLQGDHVQVALKKYISPDRDAELDTLRALIREEMAAGFFNLDIDTSTLVDLEKGTLDEQQAVNCDLAADFTAFIRQHQPDGVTVSVGGEIGEVGGKNSDVHELHAFMRGYESALSRRGGAHIGISKISVQTGTAHGGFIGPDGKLLTDVKIDLQALEELSRVAREEYGLAGAVQHGASTLPPDAFDAFPRVGACEIHLATNFQNIVYDHPAFPGSLRDEMYAWVRENAKEEKKDKDTEEQFLYKARKKAIGPFKSQLWQLPEATRRTISTTLEEQFSYLMSKLKIQNTCAVVTKFVKPVDTLPSRENAVLAAGGKITAAERKAEGLAD
ncbi:MAG TPA: tRNA uracil 4-sulfurtransferase ThiI [Vicinamibacterales bacterium]|nr:tRNA uracil 4-sulfurtransferase ThiI [Vicinamibacterales bacterium]